VKRFCAASLCLGMVLCVPTAAEAQAERDDGPITAKVFIAAFIKSKLDDNVRAAIVSQKDGPEFLAFIETPDKFVRPSAFVPTRATLDAMKRIADSPSSSGAIGPVGPTLRPGGEVEVIAAMGTESAFIYGITDFVILRSKAELTAATFRQARRWFERDATLTALFPNMNELMNDSSQRGNQLPLLRAAAKKDLKAMPVAIWQHASEKCRKDPDCPGRRAGAIDALRMAASLAESFASRDSPIETFASLKNIDKKELFTSSGRIGLRSAAVFSDEVLVGDEDRFLEIFTAEPNFAYAVAFLSHEILDSADTAIADRMAGSRLRLARAAQSLREVKRELRMMDNDHRGSDNARRQYAETGKTFATALLHVSSIAGLVSSPESERFTNVLDRTAQMATAMLDEDYVSGVTLGLSAAQLAGLPVSEKAVRWSTFAGGLGSATKPEEVVAVLKEFALPQASYVGKRYPSETTAQHMSVHVNSYLGVSAGGEWLNETQGQASNVAPYAGLSLPVGVELSAGSTRVSFFFPILDLGAVASFRLGDAKSETAPNVTFASVIAPGVFVTFSVHKDWPVAIGAGWQYAPRLRNLVSGKEVDASRVGAFIAADIPLFRLR